MEKKKWFTVFSWGTIIISIWVIFDAFNPYIALVGEFYIYLILISGVIAIVGAIFSLGIFPTISGFAICISMIYLSFLYGFAGPILTSFIKACLLLILGCGMLLTYEKPFELQSYEIPKLGMNKGEFFALKDLGITTLRELIEEKGNEEEISSITSISVSQLRDWIQKAEKLVQEYEQTKKDQLRKDFKQKYKK